VNEFQGLLAAEVFLLAAAAIGYAFEMFNRRAIAALTMVFVLAGFTGVVFVRHYHAGHEEFIAGQSETLYHVAECIHAPGGKAVDAFASEDDAKRTGRVPCRCVTRDGLPHTLVSLPLARGQR
jgi:hypothetical protein